MFFDIFIVSFFFFIPDIIRFGLKQFLVIAPFVPQKTKKAEEEEEREIILPPTPPLRSGSGLSSSYENDSFEYFPTKAATPTKAKSSPSSNNPFDSIGKKRTNLNTSSSSFEESYYDAKENDDSDYNDDDLMFEESLPDETDGDISKLSTKFIPDKVVASKLLKETENGLFFLFLIPLFLKYKKI